MANVQVLLDEAAALGPMDSLSDALNLGRGYGLRMVFIYQSPGQLKECWPDKEQNFLANVTAVHFGVNTYEWAEELSNRLGDFTTVVESGGVSGSTSTSEPSPQRSYSQSWQRNWNQLARRLMKPEEILTLGPTVAICLVPSMPPVWVSLLKYYEDDLDPPKLSWWRIVLGMVVCLFMATGLTALSAGMATGKPVLQRSR